MSIRHFHTRCGLSANLGCRSETCCTRSLKIPLLGYIFATKGHVDINIGKNLLNSNTSSICPDNMVNFGPLAAEIGSRVWGTPANFQRFSRLGSVTTWHSSSGRQPNFAALNRRRHLYSEGRPSRWALAHIQVLFFSFFSVRHWHALKEKTLAVGLWLRFVSGKAGGFSLKVFWAPMSHVAAVRLALFSC